ncbi:hypothetical protein BDZ45DRAFT_786069 [Acephala macrosclerotiorum]|nr:hypothetical protein BDZ45DRAFT_786069 [Acephala macrosclerotiorum]
MQDSFEKFKFHFPGVRDTAARAYVRAADGCWETAIENYRSDPKPAPSDTTRDHGSSQEDTPSVKPTTPASPPSEPDSNDEPLTRQLARVAQLEQEAHRREGDGDIIIEDLEELSDTGIQISSLESEAEGKSDENSDSTNVYEDFVNTDEVSDGVDDSDIVGDTNVDGDSDDVDEELNSLQGSPNVPSSSESSGDGSTVASTLSSPLQQTITTPATTKNATRGESSDMSEESDPNDSDSLREGIDVAESLGLT